MTHAPGQSIERGIHHLALNTDDRRWLETLVAHLLERR